MIDFKTLVSGVMQPLERFVKFRVGNLQDAEDILQEVLVAAYRSAETLSDEAMFKPWILGIARNKCNDYFRSKAKRMEIPLETLDRRFGCRAEVPVSTPFTEIVATGNQQGLQILHRIAFIALAERGKGLLARNIIRRLGRLICPVFACF